MPLDEVIRLSMEGKGMMQCNCPNGSHYCDDAHSLGDMFKKGIIIDFKKDTRTDPTVWPANGGGGGRKNKKELIKVASLGAPLFAKNE